MVGRQITALDRTDLDTEQRRRWNSETDSALDKLLVEGKYWYTAIHSNALPKNLRKEIGSKIDPDVEAVAGHLRNIRVHWVKSRKYFEKPGSIIPNDRDLRSVRWFKAKFPNTTPFSSGMSVGIGYFIGAPDVLNLHNLLVEVGKVDEIIEAIDKGPKPPA